MKTLFTILLLGTLFSVKAQTYMYVDDALITPESPVSTTEEVLIQLTGNFSNPSIYLMEHIITVDGFTVHLVLNAAHDGGSSLSVLVPFDLSFSLGMFAPGEYTVELSGEFMSSDVDDLTKFNFSVEGDETDGINENKKEANIQIFPNPTTEVIKINYDNWQQNSQVQLFSIDLKLIQTKNILSKSTELDVSNLENGIYFIQIINEKGIAIRKEKIVIAH